MSPASWGAHFLDALDSEGKIKPARRRDVMLALAAYATNDGRGRGLGDPVHELVTEGRRKQSEERKAKGSKEVDYYSCCDLPHWAYACMGCTNEHLVNRTDDGGVIPWQVSVNLSRLRGAAAFFVPRAGECAQPGDVMLINRAGGHACVVRSWDAAGRVVTDNYGGPYAHRKEQQATPDGRGGWLLDGSPVMGWLDLDQVPLDGPARLPEAVEAAL